MLIRFENLLWCLLLNFVNWMHCRKDKGLYDSEINVWSWRPWHILHLMLKSWRRHQMEAFSALLALCAGNLSVTGELSSQRTSNADFDISLMSVWLSCWTNSLMTGDLRLHGVHVTSSYCYNSSPGLLLSPWELYLTHLFRALFLAHIRLNSGILKENYSYWQSFALE